MSKKPRFVVKFSRHFPDWDKKSGPSVVDTQSDDPCNWNEKTLRVAFAIQTVGHPGERDRIAERMCEIIAEALNQHAEEVPRHVKGEWK